MVGINVDLVGRMLESAIINCQHCGAEAEHGWDAHSIITSHGILELCEDCTTKFYKNVDTSKDGD